MSRSRRGVDTLKVVRPFDNLIWACGGMVDTLVLGTSAKAWEFESLHAHHTFFFTKKKKVGKKEKNILACKYNYKPFVLLGSFSL